MPSSDESWRERQAVIRELLGKESIGSQGLLLRRLAARGFKVTQPSVSRDLQEMGVAKVAGRYRLLDQLPAPAPAPELGDEARSIRRLRPAGPHLLVVHTPPGKASAVAGAIDRAGWPEVAGTLAGDDALFIATEGLQAQSRVSRRLTQLIKEI